MLPLAARPSCEVNWMVKKVKIKIKGEELVMLVCENLLLFIFWAGLCRIVCVLFFFSVCVCAARLNVETGAPIMKKKLHLVKVLGCTPRKKRGGSDSMITVDARALHQTVVLARARFFFLFGAVVARRSGNVPVLQLCVL